MAHGACEIAGCCRIHQSCVLSKVIIGSSCLLKTVFIEVLERDVIAGDIEHSTLGLVVLDLAY